MKLPSKINLAVILVCVLLFVFFRLDSPRLTSYKTNVSIINSINEIAQCYVAIKILENDLHKTISDLLANQPTTGNLNKDFAILMDKNRVQLGLTDGWAKNIQSAEVIDSWRRPLQFRWNKDLIGSQFDFLKTNVNCSLLIWSVGPNGLDENGFGDDVTYFPHK